MSTKDEVDAELEQRYPADQFGWLNHRIDFRLGADWEASRPITHEQVEAAAKALIARHWDGTGCGTHGANACVSCFGPSPMSAHEVARTTLEAARGV